MLKANKSKLQVTPFGAHLLSWVANGREQLYLSPKAALDGMAPIRGGVPICFPQFNMRGGLPKHGFARTQIWTQVASQAHPTFELQSSAATRAMWTHEFATRLVFEATGDALTMRWTVCNTDTKPLTFTGALHTYFAIDDLPNLVLRGLQGQRCWDSVADRTFIEEREALNFDAEFDRVFDCVSEASPSPLTLIDGSRVLQITQSASFADTVVWNPHAAKCANMSDLPPDGYQHFLCVEAAQVHQPASLAAGHSWVGWQRIEVKS